MSTKIKKLFAEAITHWLTGLLLACAIIIPVAILLHANVKPIKFLEKHGTDLSIRLGTTLYPAAAIKYSDDEEKKIIFLDLTEDACVALTESTKKENQTCHTRGVSNNQTVQAIGLALQNSEAAVVLLDLDLSDLWSTDHPKNTESEKEFLTTWALGDGPPVVAAVPGLSTKANNRMSIDEYNIPGTKLNTGRLYFSAVTTSHHDVDGVVRHLPLVVEAQNQTNNSLRYIPHAIFATHLLNEGQLESLKCLFYSAPQQCETSVKISIPNEKSYSTQSAKELYKIENTRGKRRLPFYLPVLSKASDPDILHLYERIELHRLIENSKLVISPKLTEGAIVIVGSSAPSARDHHITPLGQMPGAEILANGISAINSAGFIQPLGLTSYLYTKLISVLIASIGALASWVFIAWLNTTIFATWRYLIGLPIMGIAALSLTIFVYGRWLSTGYVTDLITPVLLVCLEVTVEALRLVLNYGELKVKTIVNFLFGLPSQEN